MKIRLYHVHIFFGILMCASAISSADNRFIYALVGIGLIVVGIWDLIKGEEETTTSKSTSQANHKPSEESDASNGEITTSQANHKPSGESDAN